LPDGCSAARVGGAHVFHSIREHSRIDESSLDQCAYEDQIFFPVRD